MKQSSIEFYRHELFKLISLNAISYKSEEEIFNQAKEMHKQESVDFAKKCLDKAKDLDIKTAFVNAEQYYNETYNIKR